MLDVQGLRIEELKARLGETEGLEQEVSRRVCGMNARIVLHHTEAKVEDRVISSGCQAEAGTAGKTSFQGAISESSFKRATAIPQHCVASTC